MPFLHLFRLILWFFREPKRLGIRASSYASLLGAIHRLRTAVAWLVFAVLIGTLGYRNIEHTSWFDSYYMSLVTLSTVGFGEVIPLSHIGRIFTSFLILFNIGFFTYAISTVTTIFADESVRAFFDEYRMMEKINQLHGHTIVCGFGRHANEVCLELTKQKIPFVVIEADSQKADRLRRETNYLFIEGDATEDAVLEWAGIRRAAVLIITLPVDANNLFVVLSARQINPGLKIISRSNNEHDEVKLKRAGADHIVIPEKIGGFYMATLVNKPDLVEFFALISNIGPSQVIFEEIPVDQLKPIYQQKRMLDSGVLHFNISIVALRFEDGRYQINPEPTAVLEPSMHVVVLGDSGQIEQFTKAVLKV